jgi:hypothetical protein
MIGILPIGRVKSVVESAKVDQTAAVDGKRPVRERANYEPLANRLRSQERAAKLAKGILPQNDIVI